MLEISGPDPLNLRILDYIMGEMWNFPEQQTGLRDVLSLILGFQDQDPSSPNPNEIKVIFAQVMTTPPHHLTRDD